MHRSGIPAPRRRALGLLSALLGGAKATTAAAQPPVSGLTGTAAAAWPVRQVRLLTPGGPGTGVDLAARLLAEGLARRLGQPLPVENRPGADGTLAAEAHARARPGESLLFSFLAVANPALHDRPLPYDPDTDLVPVAPAVTEFHAFAVPSALPATDMAGLLTLARERPGTLNWHGAAGLPHLAFRLFLRDRGAEMVFVSYRGIAAAVPDLAAGRIHLVFGPASSALGLIREGSVRALAVSARERAPALPEVPTVAEAGFPDLRLEAVYGLFGWSGMHAATRDRLAAETRTVLAEPAVADRLRAAGALPRPGTPDDLAELISQQRARAEEGARAFGSARPPG
ncbi:tripartite tricarboxylate transporter substrate binding protein [Roseomonas hellenica]|uniref:Tripartite tricarboxylate transporter substrate binding protein n=1 Tax=Plastoroseomonas hellenica TaxID=2687306 RepID=A0ABS5EUF5_9PROT|nr:tripartite tricarboxylate transporter substrate binding protein [Plastoroseomonas hellenica]MBR0663910.1 tripartite tricarboxylate transporter substrate binding protein [Plastoroseomonas hellenica]